MYSVHGNIFKEKVHINTTCTAPNDMSNDLLDQKLGDQSWMEQKNLFGFISGKS